MIFDAHFRHFKNAEREINISKLNEYGQHLIWSERLDQETKMVIYETIKLKIDTYPELNELWKEVHYKVHGHEPFV
jgi:hypothetical protein